MYGLIKICDHNIMAINQLDKTIIVRKGKNLNTIDLKVCADNFKNEYGTENGKCVGDRNAEQKYFILYTSGINTSISFKKLYIPNPFGTKILFGNRTQRFMQLKKALEQLGYSTYDLA